MPYWGPTSPLCVQVGTASPFPNALYCAGKTQAEGLASMRTADRHCRLSRMSGKGTGAAGCNWSAFAAPTQGASPLPADTELPESQCLDPDYCAVRGSLQPMAPLYDPDPTSQRYALVNPTTTGSGAPRNLLLVQPDGGGACPAGRFPVKPAVGSGGTLCAGVAPPT